MIKKGFTLIEMLVATFIASIISTILLTAFSQSLKFQKMVDTFFYLSMHESIIQNQLERDLMGAFIPLQAEPAAQPKNTPPTSSQIKAPIAPPAAPEKKIKPLEKVFYATRKNNMLDTLSFITHNPLTIYWSETAGKAKPKRARVVYRLVKEKDRTDSFVLMRQEDAELDFKKYKADENSIRGYTIIKGIKSLDIEYSAGIPEEKKSNEKSSPVPTKNSNDNKTPAKMIYTPLTSWDSDTQTKEKENEKKQLAPIPHFVHIKGELWDAYYEKSIPIAATIQLTVQDKKLTATPAPSLPTAAAQTPQSMNGATPGSTPPPIMAGEQVSLRLFGPGIALPEISPGVIDWNKLVS